MSLVSSLESFGAWLDRKRISMHLDKTLDDLRDKECHDLSDSELENREERLHDLEEYVERGVFPSNTDISRKPCFIGSVGTACAVGYLMLKDGKQDLVNHIKEEENNIYLEDVEKGEIIDWIESSGLTKQEAERIQPSYGGYTEIQFAQTCGPIACQTAIYAFGFLGSLAFGYLEFLSYRFFKKAYPDKPLKRSASILGVSTLNFLTVILGVIIIYAFLP
jgi:hypothetical protein